MQDGQTFQAPGENEEMREYFMKQALAMVFRAEPCLTASDWCPNQGEKALAAGETPVGCVIVHEGNIIGSGMNDTNRSMNVSWASDMDLQLTSSAFVRFAIVYLWEGLGY